MTVTHLKKKDVVKSKVRGVDLEFDHEKLATILGVPGKNGICEYIKEVWEESKYTKPLEITRRFANDDTIMKARRVKSVEMKPSQRRLVNLPRVMMRHMSYVISIKDHELPYGDWLTMVFEAFGVPLKRDDDEATPEEEAEDEDEGNQDDFDWEAVIDEATVEGESGSGEKFYDAEEEAQGSPELHDEIPAAATPSSAQQKDKGIAGVDPSGHTGREAEFLKFQAEFERKRANRFHDDLEKAKAENARLLALLHQAQSKPHP
ncbi:hypothetical protein Dimus_029616 [Dionaea muscipula]